MEASELYESDVCCVLLFESMTSAVREGEASQYVWKYPIEQNIIRECAQVLYVKFDPDTSCWEMSAVNQMPIEISVVMTVLTVYIKS